MCCLSKTSLNRTPTEARISSQWGCGLADEARGFPLNWVSGALIPSGTVVYLGTQGSLAPFLISFEGFLIQPEWESSGIGFEVTLPVPCTRCPQGFGVRSPCLLADRVISGLGREELLAHCELKKATSFDWAPAMGPSPLLSALHTWSH